MEGEINMFLVAIIAALCGVASLIIAEIIESAFFMTVAKICGVVVVVCLLISAIRFVFELFS